MNKDDNKKKCQNCALEFSIEADDFSFYEKMKVPPPTFCPECRMVRRFLWRNMRSLYKRVCGLCNKSLVSMYKEDGAPVYCTECFSGDSWDQYAQGLEIDWSKNFFSQIKELLGKHPRLFQHRVGTVVNSDFSNGVIDSKNLYLCFSAVGSEDAMYSEGVDYCRNSVDCFQILEVDQCYYNIFCENNYNCKFMLFSNTCLDSIFLYDCVNCQNCCLSSNLRNRKYVFRNQQLSKEAYEVEVSKLELQKYSGFANTISEFDELYKNSIHRYATIIGSQNATGDFISNSKNIYRSFNTKASCENVRYSNRVLQSKDLMDVFATLKGELVYESLSATNNTFNQICCSVCNGCKNIQYSLHCRNCSDCFGCVGLKNAQYCILNKQYSKEDYEIIMEKIKSHMTEIPYVDSRGRVYGYGEFFPFELSLFGYNETVAFDSFPMTKEQAIEMEYPWTDREDRNYKITKQGSELPDDISLVDESILNEVIACESNGDPMYQCTSAFKILGEELKFYKKHNIPLPRHCSNCRHYMRLKYVNLMRLYKRSCMCNKENHFHGGEKCKVEFETTYDPKGSEKVYCEKCYQQEIY